MPETTNAAPVPFVHAVPDGIRIILGTHLPSMTMIVSPDLYGQFLACPTAREVRGNAFAPRQDGAQ